MRQYLLEIFRQKWRVVLVVFVLLLLNVTLGFVVSAYQLPALADLQAKWSGLRLQVARAGKQNATVLYQQGAADLKKLKAALPEKREFARVLGDILEAAVSNAVEIGTITYKPVQIKDEALLSYQLSFSVNGSYAAIKSYLTDLQNNPELIVVDSVAFSNSDLYVENVVMDLHVTIYLREGA